jgi:hypothetical protein
MFCGQFDSMPRLFEIGSSDHELHTANIQGSLDDIIQIVFMCLFAVVYSSKDWISQVDADLPFVRAWSNIHADLYARLRTSTVWYLP